MVIVMLKEGQDAYKNVLLATSEDFTVADAFEIDVGLMKCVMMYTGRVADWMEICRILPFDEIVAGASIQ